MCIKSSVLQHCEVLDRSFDACKSQLAFRDDTAAARQALCLATQELSRNVRRVQCMQGMVAQMQLSNTRKVGRAPHNRGSEEGGMMQKLASVVVAYITAEDRKHIRHAKLASSDAPSAGFAALSGAHLHTSAFQC